MADPQQVQALLEALAVTGASALVTAMASDAWGATRERVLQLFRRGSRDTGDIVTQLDDDAASLRDADDREAASQKLVGAWGRRLAALLNEDPEAEEALQELIAEAHEGRRSKVQVNVSRGSGDITAVLDGAVNYYYMDSPDRRERSGGVRP